MSATLFNADRFASKAPIRNNEVNNPLSTVKRRRAVARPALRLIGGGRETASNLEMSLFGPELVSDIRQYSTENVVLIRDTLGGIPYLLALDRKGYESGVEKILDTSKIMAEPISPEQCIALIKGAEEALLQQMAA